jgi:hypothetical protein
MTDKPIELDQRRGMQAQKATDPSRPLAEVEANENALRVRHEELEAQFIAAPAKNWEEAMEKALPPSPLCCNARRGRPTCAGHLLQPCSRI